MKRLRFFSVLVALFWGLSLSVEAQSVVASGICGAGGGSNLTWELNSDSVLTISGSGAMEDYNTSPNRISTPWWTYGNEITTIVIGNSVTSIGNSAFDYYFTKLISVTIGNSVVSIGNRSFFYCSSLTSITFPNSVTSIGEDAFNGCGFTSVTFSSSVTSIGKSAFYMCRSLLSVTIPSTVTSIGVGAFGYCDGLTAINVDGGNQYFTSDNGVLFNKTKTHLLCYPAKKSGHYTVPNTVTDIVESAFSWCTLSSITLPNSLINIEQYAFWSCRFDNYPYTITIPSSVQSIGTRAFGQCDFLYTVDGGNQYYSSLDGSLFNKSKTKLIRYGAKTDATYTIPNGVTTIGEHAFEMCWAISTIIIPNSVTTIEDYAFYYCSNLNTITFPSSVTSLGRDIFISTYITSLTCLATTPPIASNYTFGSYAPVSIYIPCLTYNAYKNAPGWDKLTNLIINGSPTLDTTFYEAVKCYNVPYTDQNFTAPIDTAGVFYVTLANSTGCDSVVCLTLTESLPIPITICSATICQGDSLVFGSKTYTTSGTYYDTVPNVNSCDSVIELTLDITNCGYSVISGYVGKDSSGQKSLSQKSVSNPAENVNVYLQKDKSGSWTSVAQTLTNAEGYFEFRNVSAGKYRVILDIAGLEHIDNPQVIDVGDGDTITNIEYEITEDGIVNKSGGEVGIVGANGIRPEIRVYPNPAGNQLKISLPNPSEGGANAAEVVEVYSVVGQMVGAYAIRPENTEATIDISHLAKGMYFLKINNKVVKFIKE